MGYKPCEHGYRVDVDHPVSIDEDGITSCCGVPYTFSGDGDPYCRCCFAFVDGGENPNDGAVTVDLETGEMRPKEE